jgi:hypothetical protein
MQDADSPMEPEMALFQKALPMLMSKARLKRVCRLKNLLVSRKSDR